MTVHFSTTAYDSISEFYENYVGSALNNDLLQRTYLVNRLRWLILNIDEALDKTILIGSEYYIRFEHHAIIEFTIKSDTEILIKNITFLTQNEYIN